MKHPISLEEWNRWRNILNNPSLSDSQSVAFLQEVKQRGLEWSALVEYTQTLVDSGEHFVFPSRLPIVDKHSTGGIGDKTSLLLAPLIAALGLSAVKSSGRGLAFTGGTVDKMESIPGFSYPSSHKEISHHLNSIGFCLLSSSELLAPLDKRLYALRDKHNLVDVEDLILASIVSKKIAIQSDLIIYDVKVGKAALYKSLEEAKVLGNKLRRLTSDLGRKCMVVYSDMDTVLGETAGTYSEVLEVEEVLQGKNTETWYLTIAMARRAYTHFYGSLKDEDWEKLLLKGREEALKKWRAFIESQGGNLELLTKQKEYSAEISITESGVCTLVKAETLGYILRRNPEVQFLWSLPKARYLEAFTLFAKLLSHQPIPESIRISVEDCFEAKEKSEYRENPVLEWEQG